MQIVALPSAATGSLQLNGNAVTTTTPILVSDIALNRLKFVPAPGSTATASFTFKVIDNGPAGSNTDLTARTMTVTVSHINHAPTSNNNAVNVPQDGSYAFQVSDFPFTDSSLDVGGSLAFVKIMSKPAGSLTLDGGTIAIGQAISVADITANKLVYKPVAGTFGTAAFSFEVQDNGGTDNGGQDTSSPPSQMTINVKPIDHAPIGENRSFTVAAGSTFTFSANNFPYTDADGDALANVFVTPTDLQGGTLLGPSGTINSTTSIPIGSIDQLKFTAGAAGSTPSFTFQLQDNNANFANGGSNTDPNPKTIAFSVTPAAPVDHAPFGGDNSFSVGASVARPLTEADFGFSDRDDNPTPNNFQAVKVVSLSGGSLVGPSGPITGGNTISVKDIASGKVLFTAPSTTSSVFLVFNVQDDGLQAAGATGVDTSVAQNTLTFQVIAVNHAPTTSAHTINSALDSTLVTNGTYHFQLADFPFNDGTEGNTLANVILTNVTGGGSYSDNGRAVGAGSIVSRADITGGLFTFTPPANTAGANVGGFSFEVQDNGGADNGGQDTSAPASMSINVTAVNTAPGFRGGSEQRRHRRDRLEPRTGRCPHRCRLGDQHHYGLDGPRRRPGPDIQRHDRQRRPVEKGRRQAGHRPDHRQPDLHAQAERSWHCQRHGHAVRQRRHPQRRHQLERFRRSSRSRSASR